MKKLVAILALAILAPLLLALGGCGGGKAEDEEAVSRSVETGAVFGTAKAGDAAMPANECWLRGRRTHTWSGRSRVTQVTPRSRFVSPGLRCA